MKLTAKTYDSLTGAAPGEASDAERQNGLIHVLSLSVTKLADALINPKLVLTWILTTLGAPGAAIGALVPVREAGALLPQLVLAHRVESASRRRMFWAAGSALQGIAAIGIGTSALLLDGAVAGWAILGCLAVLAVSRSICSLSYKDALARSIPKGRRGSLTGAAAAVGAAISLGFAVLLSVGIIPLTVTALGITCMIAGLLWLLGAAIFTRLAETGGSDSNNNSALSIGHLFEPLQKDAMLRRFILSRACLTVTALCPPFILMLSAGAKDGGTGTLGPLLLATAAASILSSWVWGRFSDRSSRQTLVASGAMAAATYASLSGWAIGNNGSISALVSVGSLFLAQIAYEGVRAGRKLHLTDMAGDETRARYAALSNTIIGIVLLCGGAFGILSDVIGPAAVIGMFAALSALGALVAVSLTEVQAGTPG